MNFEKELKKRNMNIRACSIQSSIPYATLYPIVKGKVDIGTCTYYTVEKLASVLGYRPDQIVYKKEDFQSFRNQLHHQLTRDDLSTILNIIENDRVEYYELHEDYVKMLYLVATVDYVSQKYKIPLCDKYNDYRTMKLENPFFVGDAKLLGKSNQKSLQEFARYNIYEGDLYDAI